jgi:zinc transporter, ZIP family
MVEPLWSALILTGLAGLSIPIGASLALLKIDFLSDWAASEVRHGIVAFGAGALLAAVALVLIPEGSERLSPFAALFWFSIGAIAFAAIDHAIKSGGSQASQFLAMMMDYLPEAMALGALVAGDYHSALLVAGLIMIQNLPEGFNAMHEIRHASMRKPIFLIALFVLMVPLGPLAALAGVMIGPDSAVIGVVMIFASGGVLYLMFQDIAPQIPLENAWLPPLGGIFGFLLGLAGDLLI